ncbi:MULTISPECIES: glucose-1-phosphate cytidylyltransferase [Mycolicibacterium]|uniref:Glucose-1-phosphate cytidylyltransferase n=2 Tax=Mycolicibacterium TaxID=1866885 RepID=A1T1L5_MYCVP|nr:MULTISPECIES: glucose-1-phosphate cytidylyltransferase [Mycolicibacterium]ABM11065.1 glucose-1-phosphate cytidylyltransferase [Mycolicibacterium vanbaalenii PYR-1]MCV7130049.1 glucose-1-phosphate cytidylyltransferase [Mycolicibacterium vanbaalenii PYR-1]MDN4516582.1 glucose-1-phosphate cytidylyltransferase [Mycolicibacterium austroafricanum]PQP51907.1 glucose-1-phosphate cytidylyltransferase [Mycolicibacterium austroafricanum]QRZ05044.1 glucose-1-phosphate cytidylyltransferase [Mycolicibact
MKAVILAGGRGTRISEESESRPKPMVDIGGRPILWHIMKIYETAGITDFIVLVGYKGYMIKEYFMNYFLHTSDVTIDLATDSVATIQSKTEPWTVTLLDTGLNTMTGGRLLRAKEYIGDDTFCFTYGDGVSDLDVRNVIDHHRAERTTVTVTAVQPPARYGTLEFDERRVSFQEKPIGDGGWVSGGFFVAQPSVLDYISGDDTVFEQAPLQRLATDGELSAYQHSGFWRGMDTLWDKIYLNDLWDNGKAPWKIWADQLV